MSQQVSGMQVGDGGGCDGGWAHQLVVLVDQSREDVHWFERAVRFQDAVDKADDEAVDKYLQA